MVGVGPNGGFFSELKDWSERKHQILLEYLDPAAKILGSRGHIYYVDGFAGRGTYGQGARLEKGSPVKAAELAQQYEAEGKSYAFKSINVEPDDQNYANLCAATKRFGDRVLNLKGTFVEQVSRILEEIRGRPAVFFLDPFGVRGIDLSVIESIVKRGVPTDFWIRFDHTTVRRLAGSLNSETARARSLVRVLTRVYGIADTAQLSHELAGDTPTQRIDKAVSLYESQLANTFFAVRGQGFGASCPVRSIRGRKKYHMVFATAHPLGAFLASSVVYKVESKYEQDRRGFVEKQTSQPLLTGLEPTEDESFQATVQLLKADIWAENKGKTSTRQDIHINSLVKRFGEITGKHITAALRALTAEEKILNASGPVSDNNTRFTFRPTD